MADTNASDPLGLTDKPKDINCQEEDVYIERRGGGEKNERSKEFNGKERKSEGWKRRGRKEGR